MQASEETYASFIALLVGELILQWITPWHHHVPLFIGSSKIRISSSYTGRFLTYGVCLCYGDERIYNDFLQ